MGCGVFYCVICIVKFLAAEWIPIVSSANMAADPQARSFGLVSPFASAILQQLHRGVVYYLAGDCEL
jgi:hypothetical protein